MMQQQQQQQGMKSTTTLDFSKLERFALMKLLKHYNVNPTVGATHQELVAMTAKAFENTIVSEHDVILKFSHNLMRPAEGSSRLKGGRYLRNHLDSEPAKIGEQVFITFHFTSFILFPCAWYSFESYSFIKFKTITRSVVSFLMVGY